MAGMAVVVVWAQMSSWGTAWVHVYCVCMQARYAILRTWLAASASDSSAGEPFCQVAPSKDESSDDLQVRPGVVSWCVMAGHGK